MRISRTSLTANGRSLTLMALVLGAASFCSAANITYNVNLNVGAATISGFIETDGTLGILGTDSSGSLVPAILDWNLLLNDNSTAFCPQACQSDLLGPLSGSNSFMNNVVPGVGGGPLSSFSATATELVFDFSGPADFIIESTPSAICFEVATDCVSPAFGTGESLYLFTPNGQDFQFTSLSGTQVIGTATGSDSGTPEPSTFVFLGGGVTLLGFRKLLNRHPRGR